LIAHGTRPAEIAVLYRTQAQSEALENALSAAGVSYQVRGGERFFQRQDVKAAIVALRAAVRATPADLALPDAAREALAAVGWAADAPALRGAVRERWEATCALVSLAEELSAADPGATLAELVAELDERASAQHAPTLEAVTLATLHAATGREGDAVFLVGISEGLLPISYADTAETLAEERRRLDVGEARARVHLELAYAKARTPGGRASRKRSRFLEGIWDAAAPAGRRRAKTVLTGDSPLEVSLQRWRRETAEHLRRPAYTIFSNAALAEIVDAHPATLAELAAVPGIGPSIMASFGAEILAQIKRHGASATP
jgi:DNA helicase-2/ATP-dependent DNA helicase PcrA